MDETANEKLSRLLEEWAVLRARLKNIPRAVLKEKRSFLEETHCKVVKLLSGAVVIPLLVLSSLIGFFITWNVDYILHAIIITLIIMMQRSIYTLNTATQFKLDLLLLIHGLSEEVGYEKDREIEDRHSALFREISRPCCKT